jgi:GT2 family glycosyltransferase
MAVGIATAGRPEILSETLKEIRKQSRPPDLVVICPAGVPDIELELLRSQSYPYRIVTAPRGLTHQRNAILRATAAFDVVVFFDDDFLPLPNYLENAEAILRRNPDIVAMSGTPIADGINGPGLTLEEAAQISAGALTLPVSDVSGLAPDYGTYGCNMVFRLAPIRQYGLTFDEALPMYGWQEDIDFSRQLAPLGKIVRAQSLSGVHLGVKSGRTSGLRFGYSQVANPIYLMRKGTMSLSFGGKSILKNLAANLFRSVRPEAYVDRVGRLKGNLFALGDLVRGKLHPGRITELG